MLPYDNKIVTQGILVRQEFNRNQVGYTKSSALRVRLIGARPDLDVTAHHGNILNVLTSPEKMDRLMSVDATASRSISTALELHFRRAEKKHPRIVPMAIGHNADFGLMTLVTEQHAGMSLDADRRAKLALANTAVGKAYLEEYWLADSARRKTFQIEPNCSCPTFTGSFAYVLNLTSRMTNVAASWLATDASAPRAFAMDLSGGGLATGPAREIGLEWRPHRVVWDGNHGYQIRVSEEARAATLAWTRRSERMWGKKVETGGVLFGEIDELLKVVWVDEVSGPPADSLASPDGFLCGTAGVADMNGEKVKRTSGSVSFVGMWHTHPQALPIPSKTDLATMKDLLGQDTGFLGRRFVMMIVGGHLKGAVCLRDRVPEI